MRNLLRLLCCLTCVALPSYAFGEIVADSSADWATDGSQGTNGWTYGLYDATADADGTYGADDFQAFEGPTWIWTGNNWDEENSDGDNVPWTTINQGGGHPNGDNNGDVHYAVRRWVSDVTSDVEITFNLAKENVNCGNGTTAILYHNGAELGSLTVASDDGVGLSETVMASVAAGDAIDVALSPLGTDATLNDGCDGSVYGMQVDAVPEPGSALLLLVGAMLLPRRRR